jgi:hypothetical protein
MQNLADTKKKTEKQKIISRARKASRFRKEKKNRSGKKIANSLKKSKNQILPEIKKSNKNLKKLMLK